MSLRVSRVDPVAASAWAPNSGQSSALRLSSYSFWPKLSWKTCNGSISSHLELRLFTLGTIWQLASCFFRQRGKYQPYSVESDLIWVTALPHKCQWGLQSGAIIELLVCTAAGQLLALRVAPHQAVLHFFSCLMRHSATKSHYIQP